MKIQPFKLERFFARYEFQVRTILSASDCESVSLEQLLALADDESRALWQQLTLGYTESQGHPLLRSEIAQLYHAIQPNNVLVAAPEESIYLALLTLLKPGDHMIVTFPAYQSLYEIAESLGCRTTRWKLKPAGDRWTLDLDFLADAIEEQTRLLLVNFPHNPTGYVPTAAEWQEIIAIARRHNLILFSDEMYRYLALGPQAHLPAACELYHNAISLSGMSKTYGLPGLRIGWLASQHQTLLGKIASLKDYTTICNSAPSEILALIGLRAKNVLVERNLGIIQENLTAASRFFTNHKDLFSWIEPQAGSVAFPRMANGLPADDFCRQMLAKDVLIVPGTLFEYPTHFRLGLGRLDFAQGLQKVAAALV